MGVLLTDEVSSIPKGTLFYTEHQVPLGHLTHSYKVKDGFHRYWLSHLVGFSKIPANVNNFKISDLDKLNTRVRMLSSKVQLKRENVFLEKAVYQQTQAIELIISIILTEHYVPLGDLTQ